MSDGYRSIKKMVSEDFDLTLRSIVRSLSEEEITLLTDYNKTEERHDFDISTGIQPQESILRKKSVKKYELVVDSSLTTLSRKQSTISSNSEERIYTRTIVPSIELFQPKKKNKSTKLIQRFFPSFDYMKVPFEFTSIHHLPYYITVTFFNKEKLNLKVTEFYTVNMVKEKILKLINIAIEEQALYYNDKRLDGSCLLYTFDIKANSEIVFKKCKPLTIYGILEDRRIPLKVYSSTSIMKIKESFVKAIENMNSSEIELKYKDLILEEYNELYLYNVLNNDEISIILIQSNDGSISLSPGYKVVNDFFKITGNITKCNCVNIRLDAMSELLLLQMKNDSRNDPKMYHFTRLLQEFNKEKNFHHINCFKINPPSSTISLRSPNLSRSELTSTSYSGSNSSLKSMISAENNRIEMHISLKIEDSYIKKISESKDFKIFKHLLANKIGTKCNLRSVTLLYKYARATVRFIGCNEEITSYDVERIINFTKLYFEKYFKKEIVKKGGLDALTLSGSDVD